VSTDQAKEALDPSAIAFPLEKSQTFVTKSSRRNEVVL
jgi:hypothetical protein